MSVTTGLEVLLHDQFKPLAGVRVGLFTNPSAVDSHLNSTLSHFRAAAAQGLINLVALYSPEHGLDAAAPEGDLVASSTSGALPVHSLYGASQRPTAAMLEGVDLLVCDIQDIGVRYYTYAWTLTHILEAAGEYNVAVLVLDRPNPLGGAVVAGAPLAPALSSLVGRVSVPIRHGLTLGELARIFNALWNPTPVQLDVIPCEGWLRDTGWHQTGLPFVPPSPNMPHLSTVAHYPGACLIEGTNLSEGRGTALPFEIVGAPFIDGMSLATHLNALELPSVRFRSHSFQPAASKWRGERCGGVQVHITDEAQWDALHVWLQLIIAVHDLYPDSFAWLPPAENGIYHFDRLIGTSEVRQRIDAHQPLDDLFTAWQQFARTFVATRAPYLLYA